ncbi:ABC transporter permease [Xanthobacter sp. ZOL 2024]
MRAANILLLGGKELRGIARDPLMIVLIIYSFTLSVYTQATAVPDTLHRAAISIVDEDHSQISNRMVGAFREPYFNPPQLITTGEMDQRMDRGLDTFALDIPPDFQRDLLAGRSPTLQLNIDATRMSQAFAGDGYIQNILNAEVAEFLNRYRSASSGLPADLVLRARFNPNLDRSWFGAITSVISSITMLSVILTGAALIREREHGTIDHLLVMPVTPLEIMLSKVASMGLIVLVAAGLSMALVVRDWLAVPIEGSIALFLLGAGLHLVATTSMGLYLATVASTMPQFGLLLMLTLLPLESLSGATTPRESMPQIVQDIMLVAPNTHFIMLAQSVLFRGAGFSVVWPQLLVLLAIGVTFFALALWRFRAFLR